MTRLTVNNSGIKGIQGHPKMKGNSSLCVTSSTLNGNGYLKRLSLAMQALSSRIELLGNWFYKLKEAQEDGKKKK
jgi:hypothetical protein